MTRYRIDTNHLGRLVNIRSRLLDRFLDRHRKGDRFVTCVPVLCEVDAGLVSENASASSIRLIRRSAQFVRIWPLDPILGPVYGSLYIRLRKANRMMSQVDLLLAAMAKLHKLTILTTDRDFDALADIKIENWLA
jgi:predicted nucleic acid-binding protein